ncbi:MAG: hypothetical protein WCH43_09755 [Verrucomicrobiota bacterium]
MTAARIWEIACTARKQMFGRVIVEPVKVDDLIRRCRSFDVNGVLFTAIWDRTTTLADEGGHPALGLCDYDDDSPEQIMISLNENLLEGMPQLAVSTAAHEIGHAVFDRPADVHEGRMLVGVVVESGQKERQHRANPMVDSLAVAKNGNMDWAEFRANEFMGGFLVPPRLLHKRLFAYASDARLPLVECPGHHGVFGLPVVQHITSAVTDLLAEQFGVGPQFIGVRLAKYRLVANFHRYGDK